MRIAVASSDGERVDSPFEMAESFYVFDLEGQNKVFIEKRNSKRYSISVEHIETKRFKRNRFQMVLSAIQDCKSVYISQISEMLTQKLNEFGIKAKTFNGKIVQI